MIRPFHCGTQYLDWQERNCFRCTKYVEEDLDRTCEIDRALSMANFGDGEISDEIAKRMGIQCSDHFMYSWDCPERSITGSE